MHCESTTSIIHNIPIHDFFKTSLALARAWGTALLILRKFKAKSRGQIVSGFILNIVFYITFMDGMKGVIFHKGFFHNSGDDFSV